MRSLNLLAAAPAPPGGAIGVGEGLGAVQIAGTLHALAPGERAHPYRVLHAREAWALVLAGAPAVRTPAGAAQLRPGDVTCFPAGPAGAHELSGPGLVLLLEDARASAVAELPEEGLVTLGDGRWLRVTAAESAPPAREAPAGAPRDVVNVLEVPVEAAQDVPPPGFRCRSARLAPFLGSSALGATVYELDPGEAICPYHWEGADEEWLIVLAGTPTLRDPAGEHLLRPWDAAGFPTGPDGAHAVRNGGSEVARVLMLSTRPAPDVSVCVYPDSAKVGVWPGGGQFRFADDVGYWYGEA